MDTRGHGRRGGRSPKRLSLSLSLSLFSLSAPVVVVRVERAAAVEDHELLEVHHQLLRLPPQHPLRLLRLRRMGGEKEEGGETELLKT